MAHVARVSLWRAGREGSNGVAITRWRAWPGRSGRQLSGEGGRKGGRVGANLLGKERVSLFGTDRDNQGQRPRPIKAEYMTEILRVISGRGRVISWGGVGAWGGGRARGDGGMMVGNRGPCPPRGIREGRGRGPYRGFRLAPGGERPHRAVFERRRPVGAGFVIDRPNRGGEGGDAGDRIFPVGFC